MVGFGKQGWPTEAEDMVKAGWVVPRSPGEIAADLSRRFGIAVTEAMVSAKAHRLGLKPRRRIVTLNQALLEAKLMPGDWDLLRAIEQAARSGRPAPTNLEICGLFGLASVSTAARMVQRLEEARKIAVQRGADHRVITAADGSWKTAAPRGKRMPNSRPDSPRRTAPPTVAPSAPAGAAMPVEEVAALLEGPAGQPGPFEEQAPAEPNAPSAVRPAILLRPGVRYRTYQFPQGHPRTPGFRFCDAATVPGRPYCAACCAKAYVVRGQAA
ncbi:hypothetical protein [Falsiroseomonas tokyonensis]|uniref:Uncharacterized protein n=1 Tax=Falsiroseomonas tokyonensis TaxID=430521 RepID=A0ABV7BZY9_9PROT|nr:hypothetical protein [Falsiroseomonas tokyonensis]MBU8540220.1 hypothetical protein [Falsiroseomonas tokyonensis]